MRKLFYNTNVMTLTNLSLSSLSVKRIWINYMDLNVYLLTKNVMDLNQMIRKDFTNSSLLKRHDRRNSKTCMVSKPVTLVTTTKVIIFTIGTMTMLVRSIDIFRALTKFMVVLIIKEPHIRRLGMGTQR